MGLANADYLANETIGLLFDGHFAHRGSQSTNAVKIPFGSAPFLLALGVLPQVPETRDLVVRGKAGDILAIAGFKRCSDGNYSSFHYQRLHKALECFERCGFITLSADIGSKKAMDITLKPGAFGGLRGGGNGRCFLHLEKVVAVIHKALTPETKTPAAVPLLAYVARHQTQARHKFLPSIEVKISVSKLLPKLAFAGRNHTRHRQALFEAGQFLVQEGALLVAPTREEIFAPGNTVLTFVKNPAFFAITDEQRKILAKKGQCVPKQRTTANPKPASRGPASGTRAPGGRAELMQAHRKNRQAKEQSRQHNEPIRQDKQQFRQAFATEIVDLEDVIGEPNGVPTAT